MGLILASTSPRRREILALLGIPFDVISPDFDERISPHKSIEEEVLEFAIGKAQSVGNQYPGNIVIGSDTMILVDGDKIGKPTDRADAARMLRLLSGKTHRIYTSVAILDDSGGPGLRTIEEVLVDMLPFTQAGIEGYLSCNESLDKAGAYSIQGQGCNLIAAIQGDYLAAVGMPLRPVAEYLKSRHMTVDCDVDKIYNDKVFLKWRNFI